MMTLKGATCRARTEALSTGFSLMSSSRKARKPVQTASLSTCVMEFPRQLGGKNKINDRKENGRCRQKVMPVLEMGQCADGQDLARKVNQPAKGNIKPLQTRGSQLGRNAQ